MRVICAGLINLCCLLVSPSVAGQTLCKWVDAGGQTHFGDPHVAHGRCQPLDRAALPPVNSQQPAASVPRSVARASRRPRPRVARHTAASRHDCDAYRERIQTIEQQLRRGYREPAGARLHARKRRWSELLYERCY